MMKRFVSRVGEPGAIAILAAVMVAIGFAGAVVEHIRLTAATEQQGEQNSTQSGSKDQQGAADQAGNSQRSQGDQASGARQQGGSTSDSAMSVQHQAAA